MGEKFRLVFEEFLNKLYPRSDQESPMALCLEKISHMMGI